MDVIQLLCQPFEIAYPVAIAISVAGNKDLVPVVNQVCVLRLHSMCSCTAEDQHDAQKHGKDSFHQPFTAPAVRPLTICFTRKKYRITMGTAMNTLPAANREKCVSGMEYNPTATVH